jgi:hypothetical protein
MHRAFEALEADCAPYSGGVARARVSFGRFPVSGELVAFRSFIAFRPETEARIRVLLPTSRKTSVRIVTVPA